MKPFREIIYLTCLFWSTKCFWGREKYWNVFRDGQILLYLSLIFVEFHWIFHGEPLLVHWMVCDIIAVVYYHHHFLFTLGNCNVSRTSILFYSILLYIFYYEGKKLTLPYNNNNNNNNCKVLCNLEVVFSLFSLCFLQLKLQVSTNIDQTTDNRSKWWWMIAIRHDTCSTYPFRLPFLLLIII